MKHLLFDELKEKIQKDVLLLLSESVKNKKMTAKEAKLLAKSAVIHVNSTQSISQVYIGVSKLLTEHPICTELFEPVLNNVADLVVSNISTSIRKLVKNGKLDVVNNILTQLTSSDVKGEKTV